MPSFILIAPQFSSSDGSSQKWYNQLASLLYLPVALGSLLFLCIAD